jgi:8-oxo-dGTP pyrophosphatase MutT (NUDIX family)
MTAAPVREAATVVLLRDGSSGLEAWLLRRVKGMVFAGGMTVFPGGAVDASDALDSPELASVATQLGTSVDHAGRLVCAAVRETFEEVGVLLTRPVLVASEDLRVSVEARDRAFHSVLSELAGEVDVASVRPWARWITPEFEPRRYDTYFFVAGIPSGVAAAAVTSEASHADWVPVATAIAEYQAGERMMLPPTIVTLTEVSAFATVAEVLEAAAKRSLKPVEPTFSRDEHGDIWASLGTLPPLKLPRHMKPGAVS